MSGRGNGFDDPKIASLDRARREAAARARAKLGAGGGRAPRRLRDVLVGGTIVAMAVGFLVSLVAPLVRG